MRSRIATQRFGDHPIGGNSGSGDALTAGSIEPGPEGEQGWGAGALDMARDRPVADKAKTTL